MYFGMHNHTQESNITAGLDCINKLNDLVTKAKELNMSGLAITNHDNLSAIMKINQKQKELRKAEDPFVLAIGNEIYLVDEYKNDLFTEKPERQKYYHMVLIAKDKIGYQAIIELSSRAWYRSEVRFGRRRVPTFKTDIEELLQKAKGHLVATTACLGGEFPSLILADKEEEAKEFLNWCVEQFGFDDFYIELQPSTKSDQNKFNKIAIEKFFEMNFIVSTDSHYQDKEDFPIFEAFMRSQQESREIQEFYEYARLMNKKEILSYMKQYDQEFLEKAFENTLKIQSQIEFYDLEQSPKIPKVLVSIPEKTWEGSIAEYPTLQWAAAHEDMQTAFCLRTCLNKLYELNKWNKQYLDRLEEEFEVMKFQSEMLGDNFFSYANTMKHYLEVAWEVGCAVGPSRGSASGSLLNYLMEIVQCDPIQYDLPFWRYLNKTRVTPLDIDIDLMSSKRPALFEAIRRERHELGLTQVVTFRKLTLKSAIGNAARGYRSKVCPNGLDSDISIYLSSLIEVKRGFVATLQQTLEGDELRGYGVNYNFIKECKQYPGLLEIIQKIEGLIVGSGTHAAAVLFFDTDSEDNKITDHCSLMRSPNGDICSALDLHDVEPAGCYKYDYLVLNTLDIQATCFKLLQKDKIIPPELTLKECFRKYINPNTIDFDNPKIWENLYDNNVLSIFQWDAQSGRKGVAAAQPQNLAELTSLNGLIRLMTVDGEEDQLERFVKIKKHPYLFEEEMLKMGLDNEQRQIMHEELDKYNGCAATQESFMVLSQRLANYSLKEADALRKTVAKKKMNEIEMQKDFWTSKLKEKEISSSVIEYLWKVIVFPSLGYGFSLNHALPYSIIGIQCILLGGVLFPTIYWQTACLLQRSGALDGKTIDYNKIAKAVSTISKQGVNIQPVNINTSEREFTLDAANDIIYFGLDGVKGLKTKCIEKIIELRPFNSLLDFVVKTGADITSIVALIKCGAFDNFTSRIDNIEIIARLRSGQKDHLNGQNYQMITKSGLWPQNTEELRFAQRVLNFTIYLKSLPNGYLFNRFGGEEMKNWYWLDERATEFLDEIGFIYEDCILNKAKWKTFYDVALQPMKQYLKDNQEEMVNKVNENALRLWKEKYFPNNDLAQWEIETMGLCFQDHPMTHVINVEDFEELPQEPMINNIFRPQGSSRSIPMYKLTMIVGIVIAKDKLHNSITLLTPSGPVEVSFRREQFSAYDKQVSQKTNGVKKVIEKSWLNRGTGLIVHGMRQGDQFRAKTYKNSPMKHTIYKITKVLENGKIEVKKEREKGIVEESPDEEYDGCER